MAVDKSSTKATSLDSCYLSADYHDEDDDVFIEATKMSEHDEVMPLPLDTLAPDMRTSRMQQQRRSSLFEVPAFHRPGPRGSSLVSFLCEPRHDEAPSKQKKIQYENTYQMEPPAKFRADKVTTIIREMLNTHLEDMTYNPIECSTVAKTLAQEIKIKVKELDFKRYKIVSVVTIGEKKEQDVRMGSRCIWDTTWDTYSSATFENAHIYALGVVYAVYYE